MEDKKDSNKKKRGEKLLLIRRVKIVTDPD
jgi:hypothetical protein